MNHKSSIFKKISLFFVLLLFSSFVSAEVLLTTYPEKTELFPYELDILVVKILNNSENILDNLQMQKEKREGSSILQEVLFKH